MARTSTKTKAKVAVPSVPAVEVVSQETVEKCYQARATVEELKAKLKAAEKEYEAQETALVAKLKKAAVVQPGAFVAAIDVSPGRCTPKWKDEAVLLAVANGLTPSEYEESIKKKYPPKSVESLMITKLG